MKQIRTIRSLSWRAGFRDKIPTMPQVKNTGVVYAYNLVVLHEIIKALGYKGLAIIIDEAEHVRTYSVNRYLRANNFLDVLARCAHLPRSDLNNPENDYEHFNLPSFWREGPHFALFVGLTESAATRDLGRKSADMSVLIHDDNDIVQLSPPNAEAYENWILEFLTRCADRLGSKVQLLTDHKVRARLARTLRRKYEQAPADELILRNWTKLVGLAPAIMLSHEREFSAHELVNMVDSAACQIAGETLPWDD